MKPRLALLTAVFTCTATVFVVGMNSSAKAQNSDAFVTTEAYVEQFYPLWLSYYQQVVGASINRFAAPATITPVYQEVVAINVDTLYASAFIDVTAQPVVITVPATTATYSILTLDPYGDVFQAGIPALTPGVYGLTGPGYTGTLPAGITPIAMPLNNSLIIFRADNYSPTGVNQVAIAQAFQASLQIQTLSNYVANPSRGATVFFPVADFATSYKETADELIQTDPIYFLKTLQAAVQSSFAPPLSSDQTVLANAFNQLFATGSDQPDIAAGAQAAHQAILDNYYNNTGPTNWISFTDTGAWTANQFLDRSSIGEFIQYANNYSAAAYYQAFEDQTGAPLDGTAPSGYVLTFPAGNLPQANRFWSITAYTPDTVELISNTANTYEVASYTPSLQYNADGSLSIYIAQTQPAGVPTANWLPVPSGLFNVMLRVYGPEGSVAAATYVPPGIASASSVALAAAVLPLSRSVTVGATATAFATLINVGPGDAANCSIAPATTIPASFAYQTTNPTTNALTGTVNTPANIAEGASQSFVIAFTPSATFSPTNVALTFGCENAAPAPETAGIDTLDLSASATPVPDIVPVPASSDPGYVDIPSATGTGAFAVATVNLGIDATITAAANTGSATLPVTLTICQTNPTTGVCLAAPTASVAANIQPNATPTFGIFVTGSASVADSPGTNRVFVTFTDPNGVLRGETSVAVRTQ